MILSTLDIGYRDDRDVIWLRMLQSLIMILITVG